MKISIGCDHGGYILKEEIIKYLKSKSQEIIDFGVNSDTESVDYPDYAEKVANSICNKEADLGIVLCGTGIGISIAANKFKGIRCAVCHNEFTAEMSKKHNNANIIALGGRCLSKQEAVNIVKAWFESDFEGDRHQKRLEKIKYIENKNFK